LRCPRVPSASNWTLVNSHAWSPRASAISAFFPNPAPTVGGRWLVIGGFTRVNWTDSTLTDAYTSDDLGVTWQQVTTPLPFTRCEMAADIITTPTSSVLVVSGGIDFTNFTSFNDVWSSSDRGSTFQFVGQAAWPPRTAHGMVTLNNAGAASQLVVVGGYEFSNDFPIFLNDVRRHTRTHLRSQVDRDAEY
jgi:hypothetical protein